MNQPPFFLPPLDALHRLWGALPTPPDWLQAEGRNRLVLLLNHILLQEPAAMDRLKRQAGKTVQARWGDWSVWLQATPAGLLAVAPEAESADLLLGVNEPSPLALAQTLLAGGKPSVSIQGDVQLAADVAWLVDNVRWDLEEDLSRWLGDAPAHALVQWARSAVAALKSWVGQAADKGQALRGWMAPKDGASTPGGATPS
jgi:ubiquinone biosynthesis accessory factor UbiJ